MSDFSAECQAANRIAARLRGVTTPKAVRVRQEPRHVSSAASTTVATVNRPPGRPRGHGRVPTEAQLRVLAYMREFFVRNDQLPPYRSIAKHFGWKTDSCVQGFIVRLEFHGLIERNEIGNWRFPREVNQ